MIRAGSPENTQMVKGNPLELSLLARRFVTDWSGQAFVFENVAWLWRDTVGDGVVVVSGVIADCKPAAIGF